MSLKPIEANAPTNNFAQDRFYADLSFMMEPHPIRDDIIPLKDLEAIKNSVRNIILTNHGEKPFDNLFGGNVIAKLFENINSAYTPYLLSEQIVDVLKRREPRIKNISAEASLPSENTLRVRISYEVRNPPVTDVLDVEYNFSR